MLVGWLVGRGVVHPDFGVLYLFLRILSADLKAFQVICEVEVMVRNSIVQYRKPPPPPPLSAVVVVYTVELQLE